MISSLQFCYVQICSIKKNKNKQHQSYLLIENNSFVKPKLHEMCFTHRKYFRTLLVLGLTNFGLKQLVKHSKNQPITSTNPPRLPLA